MAWATLLSPMQKEPQAPKGMLPSLRRSDLAVSILRREPIVSILLSRISTKGRGVTDPQARDYTDYDSFRDARDEWNRYLKPDAETVEEMEKRMRYEDEIQRSPIRGVVSK